MSNKRLFIIFTSILLLILVFIYFMPITLQFKNSDNKITILKSQHFTLVKMTVQTDKTTYGIGEDIPLHISAKNIGLLPISCQHSNLGVNIFTPLIYHENSKREIFDSLIDKKDPNRFSRGYPDAIEELTLAPFEEKRYDTIFEQKVYSDLFGAKRINAMPGGYFIKVNCSFSEISGKFKIKIIENKNKF